MTIPLTDIELHLTRGWFNSTELDLSRLLNSGEVITIILSDGTFDVPATIGGANVISSRQKECTDQAIVKVRLTQRS